MLFMLLNILPHFLLQNFFSYFPPLKPRYVLWSEKYGNSSRIHNTNQFMCIQPGNSKIYKATTNTEREKLIKYNYSREPEYPINNNG